MTLPSRVVCDLTLTRSALRYRPGKTRNISAHLLSLLGANSGKLLLSPLLAGLIAGLGVKNEIPPPEARGIVADEALVVQIVVVRTGPEGEEVVQAPGEVVSAVGIDGLEKTHHDPDVHGGKVEILGDGDPDDGDTDGADAKKHGLDRAGVLSSHAEGSAVGVVKLVNVAVQRAVMKRPMKPVVPRVLADEEDGYLHGHFPCGREGDTKLHAAHGRKRVEEPDLRKLDGEVAEENERSAVEALLPRRDLLLLWLLALLYHASRADKKGAHERFESCTC